MSPHHVIISQHALRDLDDIWAYIAREASPTAAAAVVARILGEIDRVAEMPGLGHRRQDLSSKYRAWTVYRYLVIYRFDAQGVCVVRVVHGSRNLRRAFRP